MAEAILESISAASDAAATRQNRAHLDGADARRPVLVAVVNNHADFARIVDEGWYRIPQRRAPQRIGADYLAFYQTAVFKEKGNDASNLGQANSVTWYAPTRRYRLMTRRELIPDEADHAHANDYYYRIEIGPLQRLQHPVPATNFRRLTFIHTTLGRLFEAQDVKELFIENDPYDLLWDALKKNRLRPLRNRLVGDQPVDIALKARSGTLGINLRDTMSIGDAPAPVMADRWQLLAFSSVQIEHDLNGCLRRIGAALLTLGGSNLNTDVVAARS